MKREETMTPTTNIKENPQKQTKRIFSHQVGRKLTDEEIKKVSAAGWSMCRRTERHGPDNECKPLE